MIIEIEEDQAESILSALSSEYETFDESLIELIQNIFEAFPALEDRFNALLERKEE